MRLTLPGASTGSATITAWASYTATLTNCGTSPTQSLFWRQVGECVQIRGKVVVGTSPPASELRVGLPNSYTSDSTILTLEPCGIWFFSASNAQHGGDVIAQPSATYLCISDSQVFGNASILPTTKANANTSFTGGETFFFTNVYVKISGLTA